MLRNKYLGFALLFICLYLVMDYYFLGYKYYGYNVNNTSNLSSYIIKDTKIIIKPTILDKDWNIEGYLSGIAVDVLDLKCGSDEGAWYDKKVLDKKRYFLINVKSDEVFQFSDFYEFSDLLNQLNIYNDVSLQYALLERAITRSEKMQKHIDYSDCKVMDGVVLDY